MGTNTRFLEIERKYRANAEDWSVFVDLLKSLGPTKRKLVEGPDTYYTNGDQVLRWRHGKDKSEITVKAKKSSKDSLVREETDLNVGTNDPKTILSFIKALGYKKAFRINKKCQIFWFERKEGNVNVVIYDVTSKGHRNRRFIEIESEKGQEYQKSIDLVESWEKKLNLSAKQRERRNLYEIYSGKDSPMAEESIDGV